MQPSSQTRISVIRPQNNFTMVPNAVIREKDLSFRAVGLYAYLISLPPGAGTTLATLSGLKPEGRDAVQSAKAELEAAGFLRVVEERHQGRFAGMIWCLALKAHQFEELLSGADGDVAPAPPAAKPAKAKPAAGKPKVATPPTEKPHTGHPPHNNTSDQKTDPIQDGSPQEPVGTGPSPLEALVADWNEMARANPGIPPVTRLNQGERRAMAEARLKDPEWRKHYRAGLAQIPLREWRMGKPGKGGGPWFADFTYFVRPDTLDKLLGEAEADKAAISRKATATAAQRAADRPGAFQQ